MADVGSVPEQRRRRVAVPRREDGPDDAALTRRIESVYKMWDIVVCLVMSIV